ncbi:MAG: LLM class flavin-dependent oxidoreductase [Actinobacteria bacterium]|nr:LLM class flavin-dependent oxidoreductase [Actinomycetota bacterium]
MRFGYGLITCQRHPDDNRSDAELYAEALELAAEAESLGFDSVWTSEHHFADDSYMSALLPVSAAIAARTNSIEVGTGLVLAPLHHPLRLAEDVATVDAISGGRFILGIGLGWLDWEFDAMGVPMAERVKRTEESVQTCRSAWGDGLTAQGVSVTPKPARSGGPPIWIGAQAAPAIERAARIADGWMAGEPSLDDFAEQVATLKAELGDRSDFQIAGYWPVFVSNEDAWEQVKLCLHYMEWKYEDAAESKGRLGPRPHAPELSPEEEEELRNFVICGTPEEVAAHIGKLGEIAGPDFTFVGRLYYPGMDRGVMRKSTELFAKEVIPSLR